MTNNTTNNTEAEAMMNKTSNNNNMEAVATTDAKTKKEERTAHMKQLLKAMNDNLLVKDFSKIIPEDERGQEISVTLPTIKDFMQNIPEDERDILPELVKGKEKIRALGVFHSSNTMAHINNALGDSFSAEIYEDKTGHRFVMYLQKYKNGTSSPIMKIPQSCIMMMVQLKNANDASKKTAVHHKLEKDILEAADDYFGKFRGAPDELYDIKDIFNTLGVVLNMLPVYSDMTSELSGEEFYYCLVNKLNSFYSLRPIFNQYKAYYPVDDNTLNTLAQEMEMSKIELLKRLRQEGLLYLTPSSRGYQTNVRVKGNSAESCTEWMYCIWKLTYFAGVDENFIDDTPFPTNF